MSGTDIYLSAGGSETAEGNSLSGFIVPAGAELIVASGGIAAGIVVGAGASLSVASGGSASVALLPGGSVSSGSGASLSLTTNAPVPGATTSETYTGQVEYLTISTTGLYTLTAEGAGGGGGYYQASGGAGVEVSGVFNLSAGTVLEIVTGGGGGNI